MYACILLRFLKNVKNHREGGWGDEKMSLTGKYDENTKGPLRRKPISYQWMALCACAPARLTRQSIPHGPYLDAKGLVLKVVADRMAEQRAAIAEAQGKSSCIRERYEREFYASWIGVPKTGGCCSSLCILNGYTYAHRHEKRYALARKCSPRRHNDSTQ